MEKVKIIEIKGSGHKEINPNKISKYKKIGNIFIIIFIILLIFYNLRLYIENKVLMKEIKILYKEKEAFNNTNKMIKDKGISEQNKNEKEYKLYRLLCPKEVIGKNKIVVGGRHDGSYALLDDFSDIKIAYSFGIGSLIAFDKALADKGIDVYMYDHTINRLPYENPKFHWKKIGISSESKKTFNKKSLKELMKENGHLEEKNMIFKIDVEGSEWEVFQELTPEIFNQFKYIVLELHMYKINENYDLYLECLAKLMKDHQIFHIHCCNCGKLLNLGGENPICEVLEVSYIKREGNQFKKDESSYPIKGFDYQICPQNPNLDKENNILKYCDSE